MNKIPGLVGVKSTPINVGNGANGGFPFLVRISRTTTSPMNIQQVKSLLEQITLTFKKAPFSNYLKGKSINICILSRQDFIALGYRNEPQYDVKPQFDVRFASPELSRATLEPGFPLGAYHPVINAVLINAERLPHESTRSDHKMLKHELLHAYSAEVVKIGEKKVVRNGLSTQIELEDGTYEPRQGRWLNEGLTEYLREKTDSLIPQGLYFPLFQALSIIVRKIGEKFLFDAYFNGELENLLIAINQTYGPGAYEKLNFLADYLGDLKIAGDAAKKERDELIGFARYGFEYFIMRQWGYSPENRARAPHPLPLSEVPLELRDVLKGIKVFTSLSKDELSCFFNNLGYKAKHFSDYSFEIFGILKGEIEKETKRRIKRKRRKEEPFLLIRHFISSSRNCPAADMSIVSVRYPSFPHFLGRIKYPTSLCEVVVV